MSASLDLAWVSEGEDMPSKQISLCKALVLSASRSSYCAEDVDKQSIL